MHVAYMQPFGGQRAPKVEQGRLRQAVNQRDARTLRFEARD